METEKNKYETQLFFLIPSSKKCFFFFFDPYQQLDFA